MTELKELRQGRNENARLKRVVADLTFDKHILGEVVRKSSEAGQATRAGRLNQGAVPSEHGEGLSPGAVFTVDLLSEKPGEGSVGTSVADT